jgi:hypothetical protein
LPHQTVELENRDVPSHEAQAELEAVLRSPAFERSERLRRFLRFICELSLKGEGSRINEYLIGSEVFQRGADYSPNEDSIVRRQALTLRQKLQEYYSTEGRDHGVRIELPVGRYVPIFRRIEPAGEGPAIDADRPVSTPAKPARKQIYIKITAGALIFLAGILLGALAGKRVPLQVPRPLGPALTEIWGPWLTSGSEAVICFSNPLTSVIKRFDKPLPPDVVPKRFRAHSDEEALFRSVFKLPEGGYFYYTPVVNQMKIGEAVAGLHLTTLLSKAGVSVRSSQSRFLSWDDLRNHNYILLGHSEANHWLELILKSYPFRLVSTSGDRQRGIVNVSPATGEQPEYKISYSQAETDMDQEYGLVSVIPGIANNRRMILINGLNAQATQSATEYLTSEAMAAELLSRLKHAAPGHQGPWLFQAILRTEVYDKVPTKPTLVTLRVLGNQ